MKIAIIIERTDIALGGAERSVFELRSALTERGIEVHILAAKGQTNAKNIHILCQEMTGRRICHSVFGKSLQKHLSENKYDIIHSVLPFEFADVYQPRGGSYAETIIRNAASYDNKVIEAYKKITAFANYRRTSLLIAEKKLCKNPDGPIVAALSEYVAQQFRKHYGLGNERVKVIANGIGFNRPIDRAGTEKLRTQILAKLKLKEADEPVLFLFAAHNFRLKGLRPLIKGFRRAIDDQASKKAYLVIAGRGKSYKYRCLAKRLGVDKRIVFLGKIRHIQNALSITDVGVLPTYYDPSSRFILEALAAGKPVITTKFNGAVDLFGDGRCGKVIDSSGDIAALGQAIGYFSNRDNIAKASRAIIENDLKSEFSINRAAKKLQCLYETIIERRKR